MTPLPTTNIWDTYSLVGSRSEEIYLVIVIVVVVVVVLGDIFIPHGDVSTYLTLMSSLELGHGLNHYIKNVFCDSPAIIKCYLRAR